MLEDFTRFASWLGNYVHVQYIQFIYSWVHPNLLSLPVTSFNEKKAQYSVYGLNAWMCMPYYVIVLHLWIYLCMHLMVHGFLSLCMYLYVHLTFLDSLPVLFLCLLLMLLCIDSESFQFAGSLTLSRPYFTFSRALGTLHNSIFLCVISNNTV